MQEDLTNNVAARPQQEQLDENVILDPLQELIDRGMENLKRIGLVNVKDIIEGFADKDRIGRHTTCIEIREEYWDPLTKKVLRSVSRATTIEPEIRVLNSGEYTTVVLYFEKYHSDMNLIWNILEKYGQESQEVTGASTEIPVIIITGVPMILGGKYGMVATDPRFWCLQPSIPSQERCDEIRILFPPEAVLFIRDDSLDTEAIRNRVKSELAAEQLIIEDRMKKDFEDEQFKKERNNMVSDYLETERRNRHSFRATEKKKNASDDEPAK